MGNEGLIFKAIQNRLLDDESILFAYPSNIGFYSLTEKRILSTTKVWNHRNANIKHFRN